MPSIRDSIGFECMYINQVSKLFNRIKSNIYENIHISFTFFIEFRAFKHMALELHKFQIMKKAIKSGRLSNGLELGKGRIVHLVREYGFGQSVCGAKPGTKSALGFIETEMPLNCPKCIKKLHQTIEKIEEQYAECK